MNSIISVNNAISRDLQHLSTVSHNLSNVNTTGFLQKVSFDESIESSAIYQEKLIVPEDSGSIRKTERALDIAIMGEGYFLLDDNNKLVLSRDGRFHINSEGFLSHSSGALLQSHSGPIQVTGTNVRIEGDGTVYDNNVSVGNIRLVTSSDLKQSSSGIYLADNFYQVEQVRVQDKALNNSTVNASSETLRMIELSRHLQSLQKAAQTYDQMLQNGISELGKSK